jgi:tagatose 1,6-diphosphate aldolase
VSSQDACQAITSACGGVPWALLSAGCEYDEFVEQLEVAVSNGCSGFVAGAAIWKDAIAIVDRRERQEWLGANVPNRIQQLTPVDMKQSVFGAAL